MGGKGDERTVLKPIKPLAVRYNDTRRTLKYYKEQLKMKSKRSRLLIVAIADKLNEKEMEIVKIRQECDLKLSTIWQQLLLLQGNLNKEQLRLNQMLQDKENIILSQRQEILRLKTTLELAEKSSNIVSNITSKVNTSGSFRRGKRSHVSSHVSAGHAAAEQPSSSTDDSSPGCTPKQRTPGHVSHVARSRDQDSTDHSQDSKNVNLSRQKLIKGSERPKLKQTNSNSSVVEDTKSPKGILKSATPIKSIITTGGVVKPPIPSRNKVNEMLKSDDRLNTSHVYRNISDSSTDQPPPVPQRSSSSDSAMASRSSSGTSVDTTVDTRSRWGNPVSVSRDSGNSSLDSSDPSSSMEWRLSVRSTIPIHNNCNNNVDEKVVPDTKSQRKTKPPPPPRRSKSYERPNNSVTNTGPDIQENYEEYDLSTMDNVSVSSRQNVKKVSFQETIPATGSLKRMPSHPDIPTYQHHNNQSSSSPPQVPARNIFFTSSKDNQTPLSFSSFKSDPKPKVYEKSLIQNFDSSSVLGKLLKDSMIASNVVQEPRLATENLMPEKNVNITKTQCDYKYYF